jgi:phosphatidylglycerol---prolipoprotein diacylglyceryl transferase
MILAIRIAGFPMYVHTIFEMLAYTVGFQVYLRTRRKERLPTQQMLLVLLVTILGAVIGSKLLNLADYPIQTMHNIGNIVFLVRDGGKTIVGGLLGGLIAVELVKRGLGISQSTGDDMAIPLIVGIAIGRIGCFLTGLSDDTSGLPTTWVTGIDFGDGIPRHPAQLYEIAFLMVLLLFILRIRPRAEDGQVFQVFMIGYLLFRLFIDFIKPGEHLLLGMTAIQLACIAGLIYYAKFLPSLTKTLFASPSRPQIETIYDIEGF